MNKDNLYDNNGKRIKTSNYTLPMIMDYYNLQELQCFFCNRKEKELGKQETFEIEHIIQLEGINNKEADDILSNLQILCTACHKMKNWMIIFMKYRSEKPWYYKFQQDNPDLIEKWNNNKINMMDFI